MTKRRYIEVVDDTGQERFTKSEKACFEVLDTLYTRWAERGDFELVIKCKSIKDEQQIRHRIREAPNLWICRDEPLHELIATASAVVGFNSLAMIESLMSDACLIVPRWGQTDLPTEELQFEPEDPLTRKVIRFAGSAEDLVAEVEAALAARGSRNDRSTRRDLMQRYLHFSEEIPSAVKVADFIEKFARQTPGKRNTAACVAK